MIRLLAPLVTAMLLTACGIDGPPEPPGDSTPGITFSGEAQIGIKADV